MKNELEAVITMVEHNGDYFVSSREVAERFGKEHHNVLKAIKNLQVSENFNLVNFEAIYDVDQYGRDQKVVLMTRDGFSMLAFGFIGHEAMKWKEAFLNAFNKMEGFIKEKVPALEARIKQLESEKQNLLLDEPKKPHHLKGTVLVPVSVNTLFGNEIEYRRVLKDCDKYSDLSYKEGEIKRLASCAIGMTKKIEQLSKEIAFLRRN